jgi:hypothetical protein
MNEKPAEPRRWRDELTRLDDVALSGRCRFEAMRGSGPGGQKRNKTSSKVRVTHVDSGLCAEAGEHREQSRNRQAALGRLRLTAAFEIRLPGEWAVEHLRSEPDWPGVGTKSARFPLIVALVFDVLDADGWTVFQSAGRLDIGSATLSKWLTGDEELWTQVNRHRQAVGLKPLR